MKKLFTKLVKIGMRIKDPSVFGLFILCIIVISYTAGWNKITLKTAIKYTTDLVMNEEEVVIKSVKAVNDSTETK